MHSSLSSPLHLCPAVNEILAEQGHGVAGAGFALAAATQGRRDPSRDQPILWVRQSVAVAEFGCCYGPGCELLGMAPSRLLLVHLQTVRDVLRAGLEGARCAALDAVIIETATAIDFTASRRLKLAAVQAGVPVILLCHTTSVEPTAAGVRWRVRGAPMRTTDRPTFAATLLKHPTLSPGARHVVEWDRNQRALIAALSEPVATVPGGRSLAA